jgi:hypothetical protein
MTAAIQMQIPDDLTPHNPYVKYGNSIMVPSVQQKSSGLKFSKSRTGSHVTYSCHHYSSPFTFPIFLHYWHFYAFHSL